MQVGRAATGPASIPVQTALGVHRRLAKTAPMSVGVCDAANGLASGSTQ